MNSWTERCLQYAGQIQSFFGNRGKLEEVLEPRGVVVLEAPTIGGDTQSDAGQRIRYLGLAKKVDGGSNLANTGAIVGTPACMTPEQARCEKGLSTAADVYSLGVIFYALLTGRPPYQAATPLDTILEVLEKEPTRPRYFKQSVDRDLETIALKCQHKEPSQRYSSAVIGIY